MRQGKIDAIVWRMGSGLCLELLGWIRFDLDIFLVSPKRFGFRTKYWIIEVVLRLVIIAIFCVIIAIFCVEIEILPVRNAVLCGYFSGFKPWDLIIRHMLG
jgi:hypothetical protein